MRKSTISHWFDTLFWYLIYALPIFAFLIVLCKTGSTTLAGSMSACGLDIFTNNAIFNAIFGLLGSTSDILPLFNSPDILLIVTWFLSCLVLHLIVDVLAWIPRFCHKFLGKTLD